MFLRVRAVAISRGLALYSPQNFSPPQKTRESWHFLTVSVWKMESWAEHRLHFTRSPYKSTVNKTRRNRERFQEKQRHRWPAKSADIARFLPSNQCKYATNHLLCTKNQYTTIFSCARRNSDGKRWDRRGFIQRCENSTKPNKWSIKTDRKSKVGEFYSRKWKKESLILQMTSRKCKRSGFWAEKRSTLCTLWSASSSDTNPKWTSTRISTRSEASAEDLCPRRIVTVDFLPYLFFVEFRNYRFLLNKVFLQK